MEKVLLFLSLIYNSEEQNFLGALKYELKENQKPLEEQNKKVMEKLLKKINQMEKMKVTENY
ncbi:MAG: hypothetical protein KKB21_03655 [Nanoarchaeota archaeon]|nr:hypothetical protein [Nanoarchaeota archaeon]MBU4086644.1 hypothetical protein [Nanoarchaeota archaeon]